MKKILIVGASAAGMGALSYLRSLNPDAHITCIAAQTVLPYNTCLLAERCAGTLAPERVFLKPSSFFETARIHLQLGVRIIRFEPENQRVVDAHNQYYEYDKLLVAIGTQPILPPLEGIASIEGVFTFHSLHDINTLDAYIHKHTVRNVTVIGGGLTGLEAADALSQRGLNIRIIEAHDHLLSRQIDSHGAAVLQEIIAKQEVTVHTNVRIVALNSRHNLVTGVIDTSGTEYATDMVIIAIGTRADTTLLKSLNITLHEESILVNEFLQTSNPTIWAAGDVCALPDQRTGIIQRSVLWPDALQQGACAAHSMSGNTSKPYPGLMAISSSSFFGQRFASYGPLSRLPEGWSTLRIESHNGYHLFLLDEQEALGGFVLLGNAKGVSMLRRMIAARKPVDEAALFALAHNEKAA